MTEGEKSACETSSLYWQWRFVCSFCHSDHSFFTAWPLSSTWRRRWRFTGLICQFWDNNGKNNSRKGRNGFLTPLLSSSLTGLSKSLFIDPWNTQSFSSPPWRKWSKTSLRAQWVFKKGLFQRLHSSFPRLSKQQEQLWDDHCVPGSFPRPLIKYPCSFLPDILSCLMGVLMQSLFQLWDQGACFGIWTRALWGRKEKGYTVHIRCRTISI